MIFKLLGTRGLHNLLCCALFLFPLTYVSAQGHREGRTFNKGSKVYKAEYKVYYKLKRLNTKGEIITKKDSIYLQAESGRMDSIIIEIASGKAGLVSDISFGEAEESNRLYVNPYAVFDATEDSYVDEDAIYYYELHNRQSVSMRFRNFSIKLLSVPLKVRIGSDEHEFSSDANLGAFAGYSWGKDKFTHREKIGNTKTETKRTVGLLIGSEHLEFDFVDENGESIEEETAILSVGTGIIYSYQKLTAGITGGFDFALGENADKWDYHARPWIGLAVGFSLFSF